MNIDRHNYEEFFILYLDNELSVSDRQRVEEFAGANPDLKAELELLLQSKLEPETAITFEGKASLLKQEEEIAGETAGMLLYLDNEMDPAQRNSFEEWIAQHPEAKKEFEAFRHTKLQPEHIVFPHKQSLYRQEERRVIAIRWWRMAAAAVLLLGVSTAAFMFNQNRIAQKLADNNRAEQQKRELAILKAMPAVTDTPFPSSQDVVKTTTGESTDAAVTTVTESSTTSAADRTASFSGTNKTYQQPADNSRNNYTDASTRIEENRAENNTDEPAHVIITKRADLSKTLDASSAVDYNALEAGPSLTINKQINPLPSVTQEEDQPLDIMNEPGKKNRLRGFFRKITRTFEKTTNIKATDGEDRLLVGGLAIKF